MATETTQPSRLRPYPISAQGSAADALAELVKMFGPLPGGYIKIHAQVVESVPVQLELQLSSAQDFEQWRSALQIASAAVSLCATTGENVWLTAESVFHGVRVEVTGFGVPLTAEQANTPQADAPAVAA
ncbi:hypothetical protein [Streptomyces sp. NPDC059489]|uniref:hypothetical protein n=1 Tax=Streptomyces sp. NPDC059489 TaxID=3346849 RepID=UPI00369EE2CE